MREHTHTLATFAFLSLLITTILNLLVFFFQELPVGGGSVLTLNIVFILHMSMMEKACWLICKDAFFRSFLHWLICLTLNMSLPLRHPGFGEFCLFYFIIIFVLLGLFIYYYVGVAHFDVINRNSVLQTWSQHNSSQPKNFSENLCKIKDSSFLEVSNLDLTYSFP